MDYFNLFWPKNSFNNTFNDTSAIEIELHAEQMQDLNWYCCNENLAPHPWERSDLSRQFATYDWEVPGPSLLLYKHYNQVRQQVLDYIRRVS